MASEPVEDEDAFLYGDEDTNTAAKSTVSDFCACACVRVCRCVCVCVCVWRSSSLCVGKTMCGACE